MKITNIETIAITVPTNPFWSAFRKYGPLRKASFILAKIHTDEGFVGIGETITRPNFAGQPLEFVKIGIDKYLAPRIIGSNPFNLEQILTTMDWALFENAYAKTAIELAIYDLIGKALKVPVHNLIGGCYRDKILVGWEIGIESPEEMAKKAVEYVEKGIRVLKVKVGIDPDQDVERIKAVRDAVGDVTLRADVNEGWTPIGAIKAIKKIEKYDLELIEQPVPRWDLDGLARVRKAVNTPIAKKIAAIAEAADIPCLVGTEFSLASGIAAKLHLAASTKNINHACEFTEFHLLDNLAATPHEIEDGYLEVPTNPGLGLQLDESKLRKYTVSDIEQGDFHDF